jgi:hypothetical protein
MLPQHCANLRRVPQVHGQAVHRLPIQNRQNTLTWSHFVAILAEFFSFIAVFSFLIDSFSPDDRQLISGNSGTGADISRGRNVQVRATIMARVPCDTRGPHEQIFVRGVELVLVAGVERVVALHKTKQDSITMVML